jgi:hypothetical protein
MNNLLTISLLGSPKDNRPTIGSINYGNPVTGVPSGSDNVYIKMKKSQALHSWSKGNCLLLNTKYGTTREIPGSTLITPCEGKMEFSPLAPDRFHEALK